MATQPATRTIHHDALADALAAAGFKGDIVDPRHPEYDALRAVYNGMVDRRPALIARCTGADDVSVAVRAAHLYLPVGGVALHGAVERHTLASPER